MNSRIKRAFDAVHAHGPGQRGAGGVGHFERAFALHAQAHEEAARLRGGHGAVHERRESGGSHVSGQILSAGEGIQNDVDGVGVIARGQDRLGEIAEQAQPVRVRIDSGWNWTPTHGRSL